MAFLFGTWGPGSENFHSESESISDAETTDAEITTNAEPTTIDSNSKSVIENLNISEHTPLTPESLEDDLALVQPASPLTDVNSGSISPDLDKTGTQLAPNNISKPKITKKPSKSDKIALAKPKIVKKEVPSNKKVISKPDIIKKDAKTRQVQSKPKPTKGTQVVNGKNIKINAKKQTLPGSKNVLPPKSQSGKDSSNTSPNPSSRKRPSTQESTKANIKIPKLVNSSKSPATTQTLKQSKITSQKKSEPIEPIDGITSKTTKSKNGLKTVKATMQGKSPKALPHKPAIKSSKITKPLVKIKLNQEKDSKKASQSVKTPKAPASAKPLKNGLQPKSKGRPANQSANGKKTSLKKRTKGKFKKPLPVSSGTVNFTIEPSSTIEIHTSPYLDQSDSQSEICLDKRLDIKKEPTEGPSSANSTPSSVLATYARGDWEWMDGDAHFSPEINLIRLEECMCLN